jgi:transposase
VARDHEYKRLGTASILAALDLHTGRVTARVERRHRSREFIALLQDLDRSYPPECTLRLVLDNHSAHLSKETQAYLSTRPNRFQYVLTPTHGSWLNVVETLFGKMVLAAAGMGPLWRDQMGPQRQRSMAADGDTSGR